MHGATPSFMPPKSPQIHLRTARGRALPYPATYKQAILRRSRTSIFLVCSFVILAVYYLLAHREQISPLIWKLQVSPAAKPTVLQDEVKYIPGAPVPDKIAQQFHLEGLAVRIPLHPNPKPPLPVDSVFTDPWPDKPDIVKIHLSSTRFSNMPMPLPDWPTDNLKDTSRPPKLSKTPWKGLYRPEGYKGPIGLEELHAGASKEPPKIQIPTFSESAESIAVRRARQEWARRAFLHAWGGYKSKAWGHDEVKPLTGHSSNGFNGWGATIIDSLSTLLLLNLTEEYSLARAHVRQIDFSIILGESSVYGGKLQDSRTVPVFETIIRYLGGLISAYDLSGGDSLMLERAEDLAGWLTGAFE